MVTPPENGEPIFFALCREHGRELRKAEAQYAAEGYRVDVVRNALAIVRLRREAGGSRHLRACIRCGQDSGIIATFVSNPDGFDLREFLETEASA
jgi:hypothetical protein